MVCEFEYEEYLNIVENSKISTSTQTIPGLGSTTTQNASTKATKSKLSWYPTKFLSLHERQTHAQSQTTGQAKSQASQTIHSHQNQVRVGTLGSQNSENLDISAKSSLQDNSGSLEYESDGSKVSRRCSSLSSAIAAACFENQSLDLDAAKILDSNNSMNDKSPVAVNVNAAVKIDSADGTVNGNGLQNENVNGTYFVNASGNGNLKFEDAATRRKILLSLDMNVVKFNLGGIGETGVKTPDFNWRSPSSPRHWQGLGLGLAMARTVSNSTSLAGYSPCVSPLPFAMDEDLDESAAADSLASAYQELSDILKGDSAGQMAAPPLPSSLIEQRCVMERMALS